MLSRSSLETQKLELMSAMSELKLQQAALERENMELRTSLVNGTPLTNGTLNGGILNSNALNNNTIVTASMLRRAIPMGTSGARMVTSTPGNSLNASPMHHGSHGSLPSPLAAPGATSPSLVTPKTPPATYRQRVDLHYSSLPRQAFATTLSTASGSSGSSGLSTNGNGTPGVDSNANPKRNVAFGKCVTSLEDFINTINLEAEAASAAAAAAQQSASASLSAIDLPKQQPAVPAGMSSSMNALSLSAALGSNLKTLKPVSASAQNITCSAPQSPSIEDGSEQQLIDLGQDHQERATTEPPTGSTTLTLGPPLEPHLEAASTPTLLDREFHLRSKSQPQPFFVSADQLQSMEKLRGFSVPNLGSIPSPTIHTVCPGVVVTVAGANSRLRLLLET